MANDKENLKLLAYGAGALLLLGAGSDILNSILEAIGIRKSKEELENDKYDPDSGTMTVFNPFNPYDWQKDTKLVNDRVNYGSRMQTAKDGAKAIYAAMNNNINSFLDIWLPTVPDDDEQAIYEVFRSNRIKSQSMVCLMAKYFQETYKMNLYDYLRGKYWPQDGLSESELNKVISIINQKPKFLP